MSGAPESDGAAVSSARAAEPDDDQNGVSSSPAPADVEPAGAGAPSITALVERAQKAQRAWAKEPLRLRLRAMKKVERRLLARIEDLANVVHDERGTPLEEAAITEVLANARLFGAWRREAIEKFEPSVVELGQLVYPGKAGRVEREPLGVVALFAPAGHPVAAPIRAIVPALICGNAVVFQPSPGAPRTAKAVAALFDGLVPAGVVTVLPADGDPSEAAIDAGVDLVLFTGDRARCARLAALAAERGVRCRLEAGANDADIERTARALVWAAFHDAGRGGGALKRVVVEKSAERALTSRLAELAKELGAKESVIPELANASQADALRAPIEAALEAGAEIVADDEARVAPTVVSLPEGARDLALALGDAGGPVLTVCVVANEDAAVAEVHRQRDAQTISVWTKRVGYGRTFARRLRAPVVVVNNHAFGELIGEMPWTVSGASGWGAASGPSAIDALSQRKFVLTDRMVVKRETWWFPYTPALRALTIAKSLLAGGRGIFGRIRGLAQLLVSLPKRLGEG